MASIVLAIGLMGAMEVIGRSAAAAGGAQDRARALMFARSKMEEILKEPLLQVGTDQGQGVDTSTDYDWQAIIEGTQHPSLVSIMVIATNRETDVSEYVTCLRRADLNPPADTTGTGSTASTGTSSPGGVL